MNTNENIHAGHRERTINKFLNFPQSFNEHEILEVLLFYAVPRKDTNPLAHKLIRVFGSLDKVLNASSEELMTVEGVGKSVATAIRVVGTLAELASKSKLKNERISAPSNAKKVVREYLRGKPLETFIMILLNSKMDVITVLEYSDDKRDEVSADIPELSHALSIHKPKYAIIAHNHPSGVVSPSFKDDLATKKVSLICSIHGVALSDHLILGGEDVYSYRNEGKMDDITKEMDINKLLNNI